jgi:hypothetical protein
MPDSVFGVVIIPLLIGLVEVAKRAGLPDRWCPLLAVALGLAFAAAWQWSQASPDWFEALIVGCAWSLSACGLYAGSRTVLDI